MRCPNTVVLKLRVLTSTNVRGLIRSRCQSKRFSRTVISSSCAAGKIVVHHLGQPLGAQRFVLVQVERFHHNFSGGRAWKVGATPKLPGLLVGIHCL